MATIGRITASKLSVSSVFYKKSQGEGADGRIVGVVTENGIAVSRRVMCYHRKSGALVRTVISGTDGSYELNGLVAGVKYFVTSVDENNDAVQYNAVTQDLITASEVIK